MPHRTEVYVMKRWIILLMTFPLGSCIYYSNQSVNYRDSELTLIRTSENSRTETTPAAVVERPQPKTIIQTPPATVVSPGCGPFIPPIIPTKPVRLKLLPGTPMQKPIHELVTDYVSALEQHIDVIEQRYRSAIEEHNKKCTP